MIELHPVAAYHGPSPVAADPVVVVETMVPTENHPRLAAAIPALQAATADWYQVPAGSTVGSAPTKLIGEFLSGWALQALNFVNGYLNAAGCVTDPATGRALMWVGFHHPQVSLAALTLGARWLTVLAGGSTDGDGCRAALEALWNDCRLRHPDYQARIVMEAARASGVPYAPAWGQPGLWRFGQGSRSMVLFESSSCADSRVGSWVSNSKWRTKMTLRSLGIPAPPFALVEHEGELDAAVAEVGFPCVVKPIDQGCGRGVTCGLSEIGYVRDGFANARAYSVGPVMVESHVDGEDYRLMVVDGRMAAAVRREPPTVTGDGRSSIAELVAAKNDGRDARSRVRSNYVCPILLDDSASVHLAGMGMTPATVLAEGHTIRVRSNANLSTGGDCAEVTADVHADIRAMAESVARTLKVAMLGVDYLTTDISRSPAASGGQFNEINVTPALDVLVKAGWSVERAGALALGDVPARIPLCLFVVADDAQHAVLAAAREWRPPPGAGWASWDAAGAGMELSVEHGPAWPGVEVLLSHGTMTNAVVIATDRQIYEFGLPQEHFAVAYVACELDPVWQPVLQRSTGNLVHDAQHGDPAAELKTVLASFAGSLR